MDMITFGIGNYLLNAYPNLSMVFALIGTVVAFVSAIDAIIPDKIDRGFSKKVFELPIISSIIIFLARFSALRNKKDGEP